MNIVIIIISAAAVICLAVLFLCAPGRGCRETREAFMHINLAHRGLHSKNKKIPENSIAAFKAAANAGFGIELDLQFTKDEQIVVFHDDSLDRVCGVSGRVNLYTYEELRAFRLFGTEQAIPLFTDVLKTVKGRVPLLVELKNGHKNELLCRRTLELLRHYKGVYCIESFSPFIVRWFKKNAPDVLRGQLSEPVSELKESVPLPAAFALSKLLTNFLARPHFIAYYKKKRPLTAKLSESMGAMRFVWTIRPKDNPPDYEAENDAVIFEYYKPEPKF